MPNSLLARAASRLSIFTVISGLGWLIDMVLFLALVRAGMDPFFANLIGAFVAVTFVFVFAQRHVFTARGGGAVQWKLLAPYLAYQAVAVPAASALIALVASLLLGPSEALAPLPFGVAPAVLAAFVAKVLVTPLTLYANFLFSGWLMERKLSLY